jgi:hypothetical protein
MLGLKNKNMNKITIFCLFTILFYVHEHSITSTTREASEILKTLQLYCLNFDLLFLIPFGIFKPLLPEFNCFKLIVFVYLTYYAIYLIARKTIN